MNAGGGEVVEVEAEGETVGEAKWAALRELERRFPRLDRASVRFTVLAEGERGLLGVGHVPARVAAALTGPPAPAEPRGEPAPAEAGSPTAAVRELLERICAALGSPTAVEILEREGELVATLTGSELGLVIGKHGQTIDAIQYLANAVVARRMGPGTAIVVDAAGYRDRRRSSLEQAADRAAEHVLATGRPVALAPMSSVERKIVHTYLQDRGGVETESDGHEPSRFVVVRPASGA